MEPINKSRRNAVKMLMAAPALLFAPCIAQAEQQKPIPVDVSGVTDVPSLIRAIRRTAGGLLPASIKDEVFHAEFAKAFVKNARAAAERGFRIPQWVLDKLPARKVFVFIPFAAAVIVLMINGVPFSVAVETVVTAVLASIVLMASSITNALHSANKPEVVV
jgi:hypothetical protein